MLNSQADGHTWGMPFQRSTIVQYWNKDAFKAAGLDPDKAPASWDDMVAFGKKLTKRDASGHVSQWGVEIPSSGFPYWLFQALTTQNGAILANDDGTKVAFNDAHVVEAAQFFADLGQKYEVMPKGIIDWGTTPKDFFEGKTAIMWTTTGNLTNVRRTPSSPSAWRRCRRSCAAARPPAAATSTSSRPTTRPSRRRRSNSPASSPRRSTRPTGASPPAMSRPGPMPGRPRP